MYNKIIYITILFIACLCNFSTHAQKQDAIEEFFDLEINGCKQRLLIQSDNPDKNPILLYLHGGPGSSAMMYSYLYANRLKRNFTFGNWDMRGTALSLHEGMDSTKVNQKQIADDALFLIHYLMNKYHKKKIYLLGHSFGSVLGMYMVNNYPELFHAYIGVGQVINYKKSVPVVYDWLHQKLMDENDTIALSRIEKDHFPYIDLIVKYGAHHQLSINLDSVIKNSPFYFNGYLDLLKKGKHYSATNVGKNPDIFGNPGDIKKTNVPLYFFEGKNDHVIACAPELVVDYCKTVDAPIKKIIWFNNSAHYINVEEPNKFQNELIKILKATK